MRFLRYFTGVMLVIGGVTAFGCSSSALAQQGWTRVQSAIPTPAYGVWFLSERIGFLLSDPARAYRTTDGGDSWTEIVLPEGIDADWSIYRVQFRNADHGYMIGGSRGGVGPDRALLLSSIDSGATWQHVELTGVLAEAVYYDISMPSDSVWYLAGGGFVNHRGVLAKTTDAGATWQPVAMPMDYVLYHETTFRDADHGMIIGGGPRADRDSCLPNDRRR